MQPEPAWSVKDNLRAIGIRVDIKTFPVTNFFQRLARPGEPLDLAIAGWRMSVAVDHVDGHWRTGFLQTNELGESIFVLHATGPDADTAIRRLAELID